MPIKDQLCQQCRKKVDGIFWLPPIHANVCYDCREEFEVARPDWRIEEARKNVDRAYEAYVNAEEDLAELLNEPR